jgi:GNAT superfamily N-acetyltransferase
VWEDYREALLANPDAIDLPAEQIEAGRTFVAELNGAVVGFSVVLRRKDGNSELDGLFVEPSQWKQGIGRRLVQDASRFAAFEGATTLHVVANPLALGFYEACGFERSGEVQTRFGSAFTMRKELQ